MMERTSLSIFLLLMATLTACTKSDEVKNELVREDTSVIVPKHFPKINYPTDNHYTFARWSLGKKLFYEKALSRTNEVSCGSCHQLAFSMADNEITSKGVEQRLNTRNTPSLANIAYHPYFTREGGVPTLEMQALVPIQEHNEFDFNIVEIEERLKSNNGYQQMSNTAYGRPLDYYVITRSLANFQRSLISGNAFYDKYKNSEVTLNASQQNGLNLFLGKANCVACHSGFNFTNYAFENNGLYQNYNDIGKMRLTSNAADLGKFKVPSLRNVSVTAPYMHDGSMLNLFKVVEHYNNGGQPHPNKSTFIKPLGLSETEINDLVQFLETLTDYEFLQNKKFAHE